MSVPLLLSQLFPYTTLFRSAFLERRFRHREDRAALFDAEVVVREPARWPLFALVIGRQVGADDLPTLPAVGRDMQILAADIHSVAVVRRDVNHVRPVPAVLGSDRGRVEEFLRPYVDRARNAGSDIIAFDAARVAGTPDDIGIFRIRNRKTRFTAGRALPCNVTA